MLLRIVEKRVGADLAVGSSGSDLCRSYLWIRRLSDINSIDLSNELAERLRDFWYSTGDILFLESKQREDESVPPEVIRVVAERISGRRCLFVFGAGHVGRSIALMGIMLGLEVTLIDDRQEFLETERLPGYNIMLGDFNCIGKSLLLDKRAAVVIVTRGHQYDEIILRQIADHSAGYIGMIGSRRRVEGVFRRLRQAGVPEVFLSLVKAPIGLDIGAQSPQEIAVSVHAEIIKHFSSIDEIVS